MKNDGRTEVIFSMKGTHKNMQHINVNSTICYHFSTLENSKDDSTLETTIKILKIIKQNLTLCLWTIKSIWKVIIHSYRDRSDPSRIFTGTNLSVMYAKTFSCCVLDVIQFVNLASIFCLEFEYNLFMLPIGRV